MKRILLTNDDGIESEGLLNIVKGDVDHVFSGMHFG